jgi:formylmethanofuran dehydrogenase subunit E
MPSQPIKPSYTYKDKNKKCSECGETSTTVNKSIKFDRNLCIDCLKKIIIQTKT